MLVKFIHEALIEPVGVIVVVLASELKLEILINLVLLSNIFDVLQFKDFDNLEFKGVMIPPTAIAIDHDDGDDHYHKNKLKFLFYKR